MRYWLLLAISVFFTISSYSLALAEAASLRILTDDKIIPPAIVERFTRETGIRLRIEYFETAGALNAYIDTDFDGDLILMRCINLAPHITANKLAFLDRSLLPNLVNLKPYNDHNPQDPHYHYTIPYIQGIVGVLYRSGMWGPGSPSWNNIFAPNMSVASFTITDQYRDAMGAALIYLGHSVNSTSPEDISQAAQVLELLTNNPAFIAFMPQERTLRFLKEKFIYAAVTYNRIAAKAMQEDPGLSFYVPNRGGFIWSYAFAANKNSPHQKEIHRWLNYLLDPDVAAEVSTWNLAASPNLKVFTRLPALVRSNPVIYSPGPVWGRSEPLRDLGAADDLYKEYWSRIK